MAFLPACGTITGKINLPTHTPMYRSTVLTFRKAPDLALVCQSRSEQEGLTFLLSSPIQTLLQALSTCKGKTGNRIQTAASWSPEQDLFLLSLKILGQQPLKPTLQAHIFFILYHWGRKTILFHFKNCAHAHLGCRSQQAEEGLQLKLPF